MDAEEVKAEALKRLKREQEGEGAPVKKKAVVCIRPCLAHMHTWRMQRMFVTNCWSVANFCTA